VPDIVALGKDHPQVISGQGDVTLYHRGLLRYTTGDTQLESYLAGDIALHPYALVALVERIAIVFCMPRHLWSRIPMEVQIRFPILLVRLLCLPTSQKNPSLKHVIGVALTTCAFTFVDYPKWTRSDQGCRSRASEALAYHYPLKSPPQPVAVDIFEGQTSALLQESIWDSRAAETSSLLSFGLIALLEHFCFHLLTDSDLAVFKQAYNQIDRNHIDYERIYSIDGSFNYKGHVERAIESCLWGSGSTLTSSLRARLECLSTIDSNHLLSPYHNDFSYLPLLKLLCQTTFSDEQRICCTMLSRALPERGSRNVSSDMFALLQGQGILQLLSAASHSKNERVAPVAMRYLWHLVDIILEGLPPNSSRIGAAYSRDEAESIISHLQQGDLTPWPKTVFEMGFSERWISDLEEMSSGAPQLILDSQIIPCLVGMRNGSYEFSKWSRSKPPSLQEGGTEVDIRLWKLYKACERALAGNSPDDSVASH
jgi:hypothetical protein